MLPERVKQENENKLQGMYTLEKMEKYRGKTSRMV